MLSQQTTKALLTTGPHHPERSQHRPGSGGLAFGLFERPSRPSPTAARPPGGDGTPVTSGREGRGGAEVVAQARKLSRRCRSSPAASDRLRGKARLYRSGRLHGASNNREILALMNRLTTALEHDSVRRLADLRAIQTGAFVLALGNFLLIVFGMLRHFRRRGRQPSLARAGPPRPGSPAWRTAKPPSPSVPGPDRRLGRRRPDRLDGSADQRPFWARHRRPDLVGLATPEATGPCHRHGGQAGRGDEFAIMCPNRMIRHVEQFCNRLERRGQRPRGRYTRAAGSGSIGIATLPAGRPTSDHLLSLADRAMYAARTPAGAAAGNIA